MGPKIFTVQECNACIGALERAFKEFDGIRERLRRTKARMDVLEMLWGDEIHSPTNPDEREYQHYLEEVEGAKHAFEATTKKVLDMEVVLKSVEAGVVDFYGVIDGRLVFLCWKRGEEAVGHFHHLEEGYDGRREIPAEYKIR